jgi:hypothetical protein
VLRIDYVWGMAPSMNKFAVYYALGILLLIVGCNQQSEIDAPTMTDDAASNAELGLSDHIEKKEDSKYLLESSSSFVMEDGGHADGYISNRKSFIKPYCSIKYSGDTMITTTLHDINGCATTIGDIQFSNDSLFLKTRVIGDVYCTSTVYQKFKYVIARDSIEQYTVIY